MSRGFDAEAHTLMLRLCRGMSAHLEPVEDDALALHCPACDVHHIRSIEAVVAFAAAYRATGDRHWANAARGLGRWAIARQNVDGAWIESEANPWRGISIFVLLALATAYRLLQTAEEPILNNDEAPRWRDAIKRGVSWAETIRPTGHIGQAAAALCRRIRWPGAARNGQFWNTNYLATLALMFHECGRALGRDFDDRSRRYLEFTLSRIGVDGLIVGEVNEPAPGWAKPFRRVDAIDPGYNLDMTLGVLALYAHHRGDDGLLERVATSAAAHLPLLYADGSVDNGMGARGYKAACWGSQTAHGLQMLAAGLASVDARFLRAGQRNMTLLQRCLHDDLLQRAPCGGDGPPPCLYASFARAANLALALAVSSPRASAADTPLPCETTAPSRWQLASLDTTVMRGGAWMMTLSGQSRDSSRLPYRFITPATGATLTRLHHDRFGPVQAAGFAVYQRVEAEHMPAQAQASAAGLVNASGDLRSIHDRRVLIEPLGPSAVHARGRLRTRRIWQRGAAYEMDYAIEHDRVVKRLQLMPNRCDHVLIEPLVAMPDARFAQPDAHHVIVERAGLRLQITLHIDAGTCRMQLAEPIQPYSPPLPIRPLHLALGAHGRQALTLIFTVTDC
ncbi:hypothetical protein [Salinisphaera sp. T31B1]|uniref:hypothetical protein n=1 Tax=Salinisphaera sp. T31B1 TaxID=727963 RepID=UPI00333F8595